MHLDYIIIYSKDVKIHLRHVEEILTVLKESGVSFKFNKCEFFPQSVNYHSHVGHVIRSGLLDVAAKNL